MTIEGSPFAVEFLFRFAEQFFDPENLFETRNHGYKQPNAPKKSCTQDGPELGFKDFLHFERNPYGAPAEKRVGLGHKRAHITGIFVGADIQGPDRNRFSGHGFHNSLIKEVLFLLARKIPVSQKRNFGAVKSNTFSAVQQRESDIAQKRHIRIERHAPTVESFRREVFEPAK